MSSHPTITTSSSSSQDIAFTLRRARPADSYQIMELYHRVYQGRYSDPMMSDPHQLHQTLLKEEYHWIIAEHDLRIIGSVVYRYDWRNALAKVYGAVVEPEFRGRNLTERLMEFGYQNLREQSPPVDVVYATTRTVSPAPQKLTANLGYKKLGVFPNVHKTDRYETHCLTAHFTPQAFERRFTDFSLHPDLAPLFEITRQECALPPLSVAPDSLLHAFRASMQKESETFVLEVIDAPGFVKHRFNKEKSRFQEHHWFFPFHEPNLILMSPDQQIEIFCFLSHTDKHGVLIGIRDGRNIGYLRILEAATRILRDLGTRYLEFIIRSDETERIDMALQAEFIPSAYFPAMHQSGNLRFDFVSFSQSFENLNFRNIQLEGVNKLYLRQYFNIWKKVSLTSLEAV